MKSKIVAVCLVDEIRVVNETLINLKNNMDDIISKNQDNDPFRTLKIIQHLIKDFEDLKEELEAELQIEEDNELVNRMR